jgi:hypothetical protein
MAVRFYVTPEGFTELAIKNRTNELKHFLNSIPEGLKKPLIAEYNSIIQHYMGKTMDCSE